MPMQHHDESGMHMGKDLWHYMGFQHWSFWITFFILIVAIFWLFFFINRKKNNK